MEPKEARALRATVEALLDQTLALYSQILAAAEQQNRASHRLQQLFSRTVEAPGESVISAYAPIVDHIWFAYDEKTDLSAKLIEKAHGEPQGPDKTRNQLRVELEDPDRSSWFSLEIEIPWSEIRLTNCLRITVAAQASERLAANIHLYAYDTKGERLEIGAQRTTIPVETAVLTQEMSITLPHDAFLDFDREPLLNLFFELKPFTLELDYLIVTPR